MNWGVLLVIGGGFAMANASDISGFSAFVATGIQENLDGLSGYESYDMSSFMTHINSLMSHIRLITDLKLNLLHLS